MAPGDTVANRVLLSNPATEFLDKVRVQQHFIFPGILLLTQLSWPVQLRSNAHTLFRASMSAAVVSYILLQAMMLSNFHDNISHSWRWVALLLSGTICVPHTHDACLPLSRAMPPDQHSVWEV